MGALNDTDDARANVEFPSRIGGMHPRTQGVPKTKQRVGGLVQSSKNSQVNFFGKQRDALLQVAGL